MSVGRERGKEKERERGRRRTGRGRNEERENERGNRFESGYISSSTALKVSKDIFTTILSGPNSPSDQTV